MKNTIIISMKVTEGVAAEGEEALGEAVTEATLMTTMTLSEVVIAEVATV